MLTLPLTHSEKKSFEDALRDSRRRIRVSAQLFTKDNDPMPTELTVLDGEVVIDTTGGPEQPTRSASITLLDPKRRLEVHIRSTSQSKLWFSRQIKVWWGIWVRPLERWVDVPIFMGFISPDITRRGAQVDVEAQGKEEQHIPPYSFPRGFSVRKHTRIHLAIRKIMRDRGESKLDLAVTNRRVGRNHSWPLGASPWHACQSLARDADKQLFFRGNGDLKLRRPPERPVWRFKEGRDATVLERPQERTSRGDVFDMVVVKGRNTVREPRKTTTTLKTRANSGATSIQVDATKNFVAGRKVEIARGTRKETRKINSVSGDTINLSGAALTRTHAKGTVVKVRWEQEREKRVIGRAQLRGSHPLSARSLTGGKRPRILIEERSRAFKFKVDKVGRKLDRSAERKLKDQRLGVGSEVSLTTVIIPHLEEGDLYSFRARGPRGVTREERLKRAAIGLGVDGRMDIDWIGTRRPFRNRPEGKGRGGRGKGRGGRGRGRR